MLEDILAKESGKISNQINSIAGSKGGKYIISTDNTVTYNSVGFQSWDDATVISHLIVDGVDVFDTIYNLDTVTIPKGMLVTWGTIAVSITLSAGSGWLIRG